MKTMRKSMLVVVCLLSVAMTLGAAWTQKRLTNNTKDSENPAIASSGSNVYVAWSDEIFEVNYDIYFRSSTDYGATWQTAKRLTNNAGDSDHPAIAANGSDVFVVWDDDTYAGNSEIFFRKSTDGGATWQAAKRLTNNAGDSSHPAIATSGSDVFAVWVENTAGNCEIYLRKSTDGGATWQTAKRLTNNGGHSVEPVIAVNSPDIYVVWKDDTYATNDEIFFIKSTDDGATWQTAKRLTNNTGDSCFPTIAVNGVNVYVAWRDNTPGVSEVYFKRSTDEGATWKIAQQLTNTASEYYSSYPALAASGSNVFLVHENDTPGNAEVYFKKSTDGGATWPISQRLTNNTGDSWFPAIVVNDSKIYVVWQDDTPGNDEIFLKYSPL